MIQGVTLLGVVMPSVLFSKGLPCSLSSPCVLVWGKRWYYWLFWQAAVWLVAFSNWGQRGNLDFRSASISHSSYYRYVIVVMLFLSSCSWNTCEKVKLPWKNILTAQALYSAWFSFFFFFSPNLPSFFKAVSGMCFHGAKVVSLSLFDLFQMSVCLQCWIWPFSVLSKLKEAERSLLGRTNSTNSQWGPLHW